MQLGHYLSLLHRSERNLAAALREVGAHHADEVDVCVTCERFAQQVDHHVEVLAPFVERYGSDAEDEPERLHRILFDGARSGPLGLLRDLHDLYLVACECDITWTLIAQGAQGARDGELLETAQTCEKQTTIQLSWLRSRTKQAAPQALVVA